MLPLDLHLGSIGNDSKPNHRFETDLRTRSLRSLASSAQPFR
jgi:hypothetical protein